MAEPKKKPAKPLPPPPTKGPPTRGPNKPGQKPWDAAFKQVPKRRQAR